MECHYLAAMNSEALQQAALNVAQALSPDQVLVNIVSDLAREPGVALARIWLIAPGDLCDDCSMRPTCPGQVPCLHLMASAGSSRVDPQEIWSRTDGRFRRFAMGERKVGRVAASGKPLLLRVGGDEPWLVDGDWAAREGLACFAGQPLTFRGEVLGVLAVFSRQQLSEEEFGWLRTFADHAATALANSRAFEEVEELRRQLELERDYLREEIKVVQAFGRIVGESSAIQQLQHQVDLVAPTEATVLIEGESGTGKELVAVALHERSPRVGRAMVRVNCASIPRELFESEFFGHVKGSFTGAVRDRAGRFQVADGGTLFLDEVGEIPIELQGKLLRALQEGQFSRVGEDHERTVDVRVIAATNRDLLTEVRAGRFREDLYYRLTVFPVRVPPLRERRSDIPLLAQHFVESGCSGPVSRCPKLRQVDLDALQRYDWPGNVRELQNVIERGLIGAHKGRLALDVPTSRSPVDQREPPDEAAPRLLTFAGLKQLEHDNTLAVLNHTRWKLAGPGGAAELLGMHPATLTSRLRTMGIERPRSSSGP
ncbi:MAG: transcriptional regulator with GAF, ATPase, and Fis domain [Chlamydiales bacterium]|jgi:transcriptional regulator with GAF, ATPase, and Fis domain